MVRMQIQFSEKQRMELRKRAEAQGISVAELVRKYVDMGLSAIPDDNETRKEALSVIGCFRSEKGDLSINHDKYLAEAYDR